MKERENYQLDEVTNEVGANFIEMRVYRQDGKKFIQLVTPVFVEFDEFL